MFEWLFIFLEQSLQNTHNQGVVLVNTEEYMYAITFVWCVFHVEHDVPG